MCEVCVGIVTRGDETTGVLLCPHCIEEMGLSHMGTYECSEWYPFERSWHPRGEDRGYIEGHCAVCGKVFEDGDLYDSTKFLEVDR